jgi:hypothetical protein
LLTKDITHLRQGNAEKSLLAVILWRPRGLGWKTLLWDSQWHWDRFRSFTLSLKFIHILFKPSHHWRLHEERG